MKRKIINLLSRKRDGFSNFFYVIGGTAFAMLIITYLVTVFLIRNTHEKIDDAIISAGLSAVTINIDDYSLKNTGRIDRQKSLDTFKNYLKANLNVENIITAPIDLDHVSFDNNMIGDTIRLVEFTIYDIDSGFPKKIAGSGGEGLEEVSISERGGEFIKYSYVNGAWKADTVIDRRENYYKNWKPSYNTGHGIIYESSIYCKIEVPMHTLFGVTGIAPKEKIISLKNILR